jgi:D-inositol-3-phosphate glycosyltransferase
VPTKPLMLAIGDAVAATGFARVMHAILDPLCDDFEVHHLGVNYLGDPHDRRWRIYPANSGGDLHGIGRIVPLMKKLQPDVVFMMSDVWMLSRYMQAVREADPDVPVVAYCPIDAGPVDPDVVATLESISRFSVYTEYAKRQMDEAVARVRRTSPGFRFPEVDVIPHGIDTTTFHPFCGSACGDVRCEGRRGAIRQLFGDDPEMDDAFIVLNANRNQPRKRIDITVRGFAEFAEGKPPNVKLHLHMGVEDAGWNVMKLAQRFGIEDRLILTSRGNSLPSVSDEQLNAIYNAAAVGVNTSAAEGWGLVSFEHAATGAAQIVPRHSSCTELWDGAALMLEPVTTYVMEQILTDGQLVDSHDLAGALEGLYADRDLLRKMSERAYAAATCEEYRWPRIARRWLDLFSEVLAAPEEMGPLRRPSLR